MKHLVFAISVALTPVAASAQSGDVQGGLDLLQEGTRMFLRGLAEELGPQLEALKGRLGDLNAYEAPEVLPNGDIIIRRKVPLEEPLEPPVGPNGEVEL